MSTTDEATSSSTFVHTTESLRYAVTHVFLSTVPPEHDDYNEENNHSLARAVCVAARAYGSQVCKTSEQAQWHRITRMLDNLQASVQTEHLDHDVVISQLREMQTGGKFAHFLYIRADNL